MWDSRPRLSSREAAKDSLPFAAKLANNLYRPFKVPVQNFQIASRNPVFAVRGISNHVNPISTQEFRPHIKLQYVPLVTRGLIVRVPVSCNLHRILFAEHRIKERLGRQARRKRSKSAPADQIQFFSSDRSIKRRGPVPHDTPNSPSPSTPDSQSAAPQSPAAHPRQSAPAPLPPGPAHPESRVCKPSP